MISSAEAPLFTARRFERRGMQVSYQCRSQGEVPACPSMSQGVPRCLSLLPKIEACLPMHGSAGDIRAERHNSSQPATCEALLALLQKCLNLKIKSTCAFGNVFSIVFIPISLQFQHHSFQHLSAAGAG